MLKKDKFYVLVSLVFIFLAVLAYWYYSSETSHFPSVIIPFPVWTWFYHPSAWVISFIGCGLTYWRGKCCKKSFLLEKRTFIATSLYAASLALITNPYLPSVWPQYAFSFLFIFSLFLTLRGIFGRAYYIFWTPFLLLMGVSVYTVIQKIAVDSNTIVEILSTTRADAAFFITPTLILLTLALLLISLTLSYVGAYIVRRSSRLTLLGTGLSGLLFFMLLLKPMEHHIQVGEQFIWPLGSITHLGYETIKAIGYKYRMDTLFRYLPKELCSVDSCDTVKTNDDIVCILHIGESVRADHLSINGWAKDTTPHLRQNPDVINFPDCTAAAAFTTKSFITMLTDARRNYIATSDKRFYPSSGSIIDFFSSAGFDCKSYWNQWDIEREGTTPALIAYLSRAAEVIPTQGKDDQLKKISELLDKPHSGPLFISFENEGSHHPYGSYDKENPTFTPSRPLQADDKPWEHPEMAEGLVNAYDNTIVATDDFIHQLVTKLKNRPFLYVYMSDHGDYMGQEGYWTRANAPAGDFHKMGACRVPFFVIASPELLAMHPHFAKAAEQLKKHEAMKTGHEHLFHTLLGFFNMKTKYYKPEWDLSSEQVKEYAGPAPHNNGVEQDTGN